MTQYKQILGDGLWHRNPGLVQFLGICPLLAVSNSTVNGLGLGMATLCVLTASNLCVSLLRQRIPADLRLPVFVLIIASLVTMMELVAQAWFFSLWKSLGLFLPLIVTNCVILARAESFASRQPPVAALLDGIANGLGFAAVLVVLGSVRELLGHGTLLGDAEMIFGAAGSQLTLQLLPESAGFLLALTPPGAFLVLGLLIALRNLILQRSGPKPGPATAGSSAEQPAPARTA